MLVKNYSSEDHEFDDRFFSKEKRKNKFLNKYTSSSEREKRIKLPSKGRQKINNRFLEEEDDE